MEVEFWEQRWNENQIAFHSSEVNPYLIQYWREFKVDSDSKVFVPLCGKTLDLIWLAAKQNKVLGLECSGKAIKDFFIEQEMTVEISHSINFNLYQSENISLLEGDFFKLDKETLEGVSIVYDRASLIALPEEMRKRYVELLIKLLPESANIFLITLQYDQALMTGPPFSVSDDEVKKLFKSHYNIEMLVELDVLEGHQRFKQRGLSYLTERVYQLTKT